jgi:hypothetical protein
VWPFSDLTTLNVLEYGGLCTPHKFVGNCWVTTVTGYSNLTHTCGHLCLFSKHHDMHIKSSSAWGLLTQHKILSVKLEGQKRLVILGHIITTLLTMNFKCYVLFVGSQDKS